MSTDAVREARKRQDHTEELQARGWYHSFELPDGTKVDGMNPLDRLRERYAHFPIPEDLSGKRVLDIGAWDGWFTFEAERHGAAVTSIDCVEAPHFRELHSKLNSRADYRILEIYELARAGLGTFDIVFLLGVLYHLRHPLLALEIVCGLTREIAIVESFVTDADPRLGDTSNIPTMEFYEGYELANQFDNWTGPNVACLLALCRAAGFPRVKLLRTEPYNAMVACYRKWEPPPAEPLEAPPELVSAADSANFGINFSTGKEQYMACWILARRQTIAKEDLRLEVSGYGAASFWIAREDNLWHANFYLPRGLAPGWHDVRLRFATSAFSNSVRIAVDMPLRVERIVCRDVRDPHDWDATTIPSRGYLAVWAEGLPENADRANVTLELGGARLRISWMSDPNTTRQINTGSIPSLSPGQYELRIACAGVVSDPYPVTITRAF